MTLLDILYTYIYTANESPRHKTQYVLQQKSKRIDYIFLGSSRVENFINTNLIEQTTGKKALNLGIQGGRLDDVYLMLKLLKNNKVESNTVFIQIDYIYNFDGPSTIVGTEAIPYIHSNDIVRDHIKGNNSDFERLYYVPFLRYALNDYKIGFREFFMNLIHKKPRINLADGFDPKNETFVEKEYSLPESVNQRSKDFESIDRFCKENNIRVVYFCAPFCSEVANIDFINELKNKIPELKDFSRAIPYNDPEYFKDCGHVNGKGADFFTNLLIESFL